jgi:hypothetical protein
MKHLKRYLLVGVIVLSPTLPLAVHLAYAGQPMSCPVPGHGGPLCNMKTCSSYDKDGKVNGSKCSKDCAEKCCLCADSCNRHHEAPPEEHLWHL